MSQGLRIAMWSGPRNISTAMMRSFENRADCTVTDEPFYGCYLSRTGIDHPMAADVMADMDCDFTRIAQTLAGPVPGGAAIWYQKHMSLHILPGDDLSWSDDMVHCFLIRQPDAMVASYTQKREQPVAADFGFERLWQLFDHVSQKLGKAPPVLDSKDVLSDPKGTLSTLCHAIGIAFDPSMLSWPLGRRDSDGIWAPIWYKSVEQSTGFLPYQPNAVSLSPALQAIADECRPYYDQMAAHRLIQD